MPISPQIKLNAKANHRSNNQRSIPGTAPGTAPKSDKIQIKLNKKEEKFLNYLYNNPGNHHLKEIGAGIWGDIGIYNYTPGIEQTDPGKKSYRWAANAKRRLVYKQLVKEVSRGTYTITEKGKELVSKTKKEKETSNITPEQFQEKIIASHNISKSKVAKIIGIERRRWSRIVNGSKMNESERNLFVDAISTMLGSLN
tara:strand:+ start:4109 stop:4702 length:594 start_codon:yes stop_codon:yes gene_type:complete